MPVTWPAAPPVRLMGDLGLRGVRRAKSPRTTRNAARVTARVTVTQEPPSDMMSLVAVMAVHPATGLEPGAC